MKEDTLRKILSFFMLCLYVLGVIGGIGYTIYCGKSILTISGLDSFNPGCGSAARFSPPFKRRE